MSFIFKHPLIVTFGLGLMALALCLTWRKHTQLLTGDLVEGEVVELIPISYDDGLSYSLRVEYLQPGGIKGQFETSPRSKTPTPQLGEKISVVRYRDKQPDLFDFAELFLFPWVLFCLGLFTLLFFAGCFYGPVLLDAIYRPQLIR